MSMLGILALSLSACSSSQEDTLASTSIEETTTVAPSTTATFTTAPAAPTTAAKVTDAVTDPGYNLSWRIRSVTYGDNGGSTFYLNLTNLSQAPLPPSLLPAATLVVRDGSNQPTTVSQIAETTSSSTTTSNTSGPVTEKLSPGLDVNLGAGATTTIVMTFNTTVASLSNATLTIGNVSWSGNLSNISSQ